MGSLVRAAGQFTQGWSERRTGGWMSGPPEEINAIPLPAHSGKRTSEDVELYFSNLCIRLLCGIHLISKWIRASGLQW